MMKFDIISLFSAYKNNILIICVYSLFIRHIASKSGSDKSIITAIIKQNISKKNIIK